MPRPKAPPLPCDLKTISTRVPESHREALRAQAEREGVSLSELLRGQLYEAGDQAETICDAKPRKTLHAPYVEKRKLNAQEARRVAEALRAKAKAEADKKRADAAAAKAERERQAAAKAVERAEDKAARARTTTATKQAEKEAKAAQKAADKAAQQRDQAVQEANVAKAQVREAAQEANAVLVPAGHDPVPVPSDCKTCSKPAYKPNDDAVGAAIFADMTPGPTPGPTPAPDMDAEDARLVALMQKGAISGVEAYARSQGWV